MGVGSAYGGGGGEPSFEILDEVDSGLRWTNGKVIYRKGYTGTVAATNPEIAIDTTSLGIDEPVIPLFRGRVFRSVVSTEDQYVRLEATAHPSVAGDMMLCTFRKSEFRAVTSAGSSEFDNSPYVLFLYYTKV